MAITIHDLARIAKVNASTVSRALRNDARVKVETVERIQALAKEYNYIPNSNARALIRGKSGMIWLILGSLESQFERTIATLLTNRVREFGYELLIAPADSDGRHLHSILEKLQQRTADGAIVIPPVSFRGKIELSLHNSPPLIYLDRWIDGSTQPVVTTNNTLAVENLIKESIKNGATRFYLSFPGNNNVSNERLLASQNFLISKGLYFTTNAEDLNNEPFAIIADREWYALDKLSNNAFINQNHAQLIGGYFDYVEPQNSAKYYKRFLCQQNFDEITNQAVILLDQLIQKQSLPHNIYRIAPNPIVEE